MSIFLNISNPDNIYMKVELPIAWKPGVNENGWVLIKKHYIQQ